MAKVSVMSRGDVRDIEAAALFVYGRGHEIEHYTALSIAPAVLQTRETPLPDKIMLPAKSPELQLKR